MSQQNKNTELQFLFLEQNKTKQKQNHRGPFFVRR